MDLTPLQTALLILAVSLAGALLPLHRRWSDRGLHVFVSIAAGIFLGTVFLHLLPHLAGIHTEGDGHGAGSVEVERSIAPWVAALCGLLLLFAIEKVWLRSFAGPSAPDPHRALWAATWVGLGMHSLSEGIALPTILQEPSVRTQLLFSILIHKATEAFSLATVMRLARLGNLRSGLFLVLFALIGPVGILLGGELSGAGRGLDAILTGFACGTFLYVAACDLLPEVFHGTDRPMLKLVSVGIGVLATAATWPRLEAALAFVERVGRQSAGIFVEAAPYLLVGFLIAGIMNLVVRPSWLTRHMAGENLKSVAKASLIGAPLPLCSCSVVPVAVAMRKSGASKGATASFLISTPETGVDSIAISWALLDPLLTVARILGAIVSAVFVGGVVSWFVRRGFDRADDRAPSGAPVTEAACGHDHPAEAAPHVHVEPPAAAVPARPRAWPMRILHYAFVEMMDDLWASILVGILLSGVVAAAVPAELFQSPIAHGFSGLVVMFLIGIPVYVCAAGSTPIAAAFILKGMSPGAALVFLLASPATNVGTFVVLTRHLGRRVVFLMVGALAVVTLTLGWSVDRIYALWRIAPSASLGVGAEESAGVVSLAAAAILGILLVASLVRTRGALNLAGLFRGDPHPAAR
ncbi:MAG TPA: SO_0444 family Cu/Zn efflux transporter [Planctomycetota bacterium]|nr:SO_0444 family Cu/Zn efflux transporter [Planctomycetota bacterium]